MPGYGSEIYDVPRQASRCKILIYSHLSHGSTTDKSTTVGPLDCSRDVVECSTSKTIKAGGGASFLLVPRRNYLNFVFPNDYVYIYFDPGDGRGFIRTFFGFVDRIERNISVGNNGESITRYAISCSDFTKAFDKTNIYFNPHVADRGDFVSQHYSGTKQIGGSVIRSKGVNVKGTPVDVVMSLSQRLLGFGAQFAVPQGHPKIASFTQESRRRRFKNLLQTLPAQYQNLESPEELERIRSEVNAETAQLVERSDEEKFAPLAPVISFIKGMAAAGKAAQWELESSLLQQPPLTPLTYQVLKSGALKAYGEVNDPSFTSAIKEAYNIHSKELSLLDLIDFSYMEDNAVSGCILATQLWQSQGSLWSIMNSWSNDLVTELFCDLRPVGSCSTHDLRTGGYTCEADELQANTGAGVRFVPAIIMREYPFATVESVIPSASVNILGSIIGPIPLGGFGDAPVWTKGVNKTGRYVSTITALNPWRKKDTKAVKHLDVHAISVQDIVNERIGRSDADLVNLVEVYADMGMGEMGKFMDSEIQPISNPISVLRDGLRVRTYTSKFARWPAESEKNSGMDSPGARFQTIRWALLLDHWYQHSKEYLNGTFTLRAFPEIRVGCRLDIKERAESYYVEGASQQWTYTEKGGMLTTSLTVSRGQRNDPFPVYVLPALQGWGGLLNRGITSRLAQYFPQKNPSAVLRSSLRDGDTSVLTDVFLQNIADLPIKDNVWSDNKQGYLSSGSRKASSQAYIAEAWEHLGAAYEEFKRMAKEKSLEGAEYLQAKKEIIGPYLDYAESFEPKGPPPKTGGGEE